MRSGRNGVGPGEAVSRGLYAHTDGYVSAVAVCQSPQRRRIGCCYRRPIRALGGGEDLIADHDVVGCTLGQVPHWDVLREFLLGPVDSVSRAQNDSVGCEFIESRK